MALLLCGCAHPAGEFNGLGKVLELEDPLQAPDPLPL